jgi:hypothetical protein
MEKAVSRGTVGAPGETLCGLVPGASGRWRFIAGLVAGMTIALGVALAPSLTHPAAAQPAAPRAETRTATMPDDTALAARWEALYTRFIDTAAPLVEAFHRADRLAEELPERQTQVRETEAAFLAAGRARETAEAELANYLDTELKIEQKSAQSELTQAELIASEYQGKLEDLRRVRQKLTVSWTADGRTQESAEAAARLLFDKDIWQAENRLQQALHAYNQAKARRDLLVSYDQSRKTMILRAEIEARRARELACLAAWEKARSRAAQIQARLERHDLAPKERRLRDRLLAIVRTSGAWPSPHAGRAELQAFLDRFEAGLSGAGEVARRLRAERYDNLLDRLNQVQDRPAGP